MVDIVTFLTRKSTARNNFFLRFCEGNTIPCQTPKTAIKALHFLKVNFLHQERMIDSLLINKYLIILGINWAVFPILVEPILDYPILDFPVYVKKSGVPEIGSTAGISSIQWVILRCISQILPDIPVE